MEHKNLIENGTKTKFQSNSLIHVFDIQKQSMLNDDGVVGTIVSFHDVDPRSIPDYRSVQCFLYWR